MALKLYQFNEVFAHFVVRIQLDNIAAAHTRNFLPREQRLKITSHICCICIMLIRPEEGKISGSHLDKEII